MAGFTFVFMMLVMSCLAQMYEPLYEGDVCKLKNGKKGLCKLLSDCKPAYEQLTTSGIRPIHCSYKGSEEVVCCDDEKSQRLRISDIECLQYQNAIPFTVTPFIRKGKNADPGDYPHMAALGYIDDPLEPSKIEWKCGGSLISDRFVLTAAHCVVPSSPTEKPPAVVMLGSVQLNNQKSQIYGVKNCTAHPEYSSLFIYDDIALIELDRSVRFSDTVQPACLNTKSDIPDIRMSITGWGATDSRREDTRSNILQQASLRIMPKDKCSKGYVNVVKVSNGLVDTMVCAGDPKGEMDTCSGDSGGPLQMQGTEFNSYIIVGITSYGPKPCGGTTPGIYTRVDKYLDWLESIVWK